MPSGHWPDKAGRNLAACVVVDVLVRIGLIVPPENREVVGFVPVLLYLDPPASPVDVLLAGRQQVPEGRRERVGVEDWVELLVVLVLGEHESTLNLHAVLPDLRCRDAVPIDGDLIVETADQVGIILHAPVSERGEPGCCVSPHVLERQHAVLLLVVVAVVGRGPAGVRPVEDLPDDAPALSDVGPLDADLILIELERGAAGEIRHRARQVARKRIGSADARRPVQPAEAHPRQCVELAQAEGPEAVGLAVDAPGGDHGLDDLLVARPFQLDETAEVLGDRARVEQRRVIELERRGFRGPGIGRRILG